MKQPGSSVSRSPLRVLQYEYVIAHTPSPCPSLMTGLGRQQMDLYSYVIVSSRSVAGRLRTRHRQSWGFYHHFPAVQSSADASHHYSSVGIETGRRVEDRSRAGVSRARDQKVPRKSTRGMVMARPCVVPPWRGTSHSGWRVVRLAAARC